MIFFLNFTRDKFFCDRHEKGCQLYIFNLITRERMETQNQRFIKGKMTKEKKSNMVEKKCQFM